jgi:hypothetical protein
VSSLWPKATTPRQARPCAASPQLRPLAAHTARAQPEHGHNALTTRGRGQSGAMTTQLAAHRRRGFGEVCGKTIYEVWPSWHYTRTGEGRLGRGVLTGGELRMVENGGVDEGNWREYVEELPGLILQLQRKKEHMRRRHDQPTNDERHRGELSSADGGQRRRDPRWRP